MKNAAQILQEIAQEKIKLIEIGRASCRERVSDTV